MRTCRCPKCGANLSFDDSNREFAFCEYCGAKVMFDDYRSTHRVVDEARIHEDETDRMIRMRELDMEEKERERNHKARMIAYLIAGIVAALCIVIIVICFGVNKDQNSQAGVEPKLPTTDSTLSISPEEPSNTVTAEQNKESENTAETVEPQVSEFFGVESDNAVEVIVQANDYLDVKEFGWFINCGYLYCVITITNLDTEYAVEFPSFRITAYDNDGKILGVVEHMLGVIYPSQDYTMCCLLFELSKKPSAIDITLLKPNEYDITSVDLLEHPLYKQMISRNISVDKDSVKGEIYNPNDYDVDSAMITIVFRNSEGTIVFGESDFVDQIPANGTVPFDTWIYSETELPSDCEVLAYLW